MSIIREKVERIVVEDGAPVAVCDGCGKRQDPRNADCHNGYADHPVGWVVVYEAQAHALYDMRNGSLGFCSWACLLTFAFIRVGREPVPV